MFATPARLLAPVALIACVVAAVVVISSAGGGAHRTAVPANQAPPRHVPKVYRVRPGELLPQISERFGVPVSRILELNPDVDPRALQAGQEVQLRP